jgi:hypothetical protein
MLEECLDLKKFFRAIGYDDVAGALDQRLYGYENGSIERLYKVNPFDFDRDQWYTFIDRLCCWTETWVGRELFSYISDLLIEDQEEDWREVWKTCIYKKESLNTEFNWAEILIVSEKEARKTVKAVLSKHLPVVALSEVFDWSRSPEGFLYWYETSRANKLDSYLKSKLNTLLLKL